MCDSVSFANKTIVPQNYHKIELAGVTGSDQGSWFCVIVLCPSMDCQGPADITFCASTVLRHFYYASHLVTIKSSNLFLSTWIVFPVQRVKRSSQCLHPKGHYLSWANPVPQRQWVITTHLGCWKSGTVLWRAGQWEWVSDAWVVGISQQQQGYQPSAHCGLSDHWADRLKFASTQRMLPLLLIWL